MGVKSVPKFEGFYSTEGNMDNKQHAFYMHVEKNLKKGIYVDIDGQISYVFAYLYKLLDEWHQKNFQNIYDHLIYISEIYVAEKKLSNYCLHWAADCLLALKEFDLFLEKTEPSQPYGTATHSSNARLNIQEHLGLKANPLDLLLMAGGRKSKFIVQNPGLYKSKISEVFSEFTSNETEWFDLFNYWDPNNKSYPHLLFSGAVLAENPKMSFDIKAFYSITPFLEKVKLLSKEAESLARVEIGLPRVGEGWISETELYKSLERYFYQTSVVQHGKPEWLNKQHYDIWFPNWNIAVEYHGEQHFRPIEFFGGAEAYKKNVERDQRKINLSKKHGVKLIVVKENYDLANIFLEIETYISKRKVSAP